MVEYGMNEIDVLKAVTSVNAEVMHLNQLGRIKIGFMADLVAVEGSPLEDISALRNVSFVMQGGVIFKE